MTESPQAPDIMDDGTTDVLAEDEIVHVPPAGAELAEANGHSGEPGFIADVPDWDKEGSAALIDTITPAVAVPGSRRAATISATDPG